MNEENNDNINTNPEDSNNSDLQQVTHVSGMYQNWFLDYASYVILERAVPAIEDGMKPVQRRIMHSMNDLDDGRYNKVANIIGHTMKYHPHGDASIGDAIVQLGQKNLLIDMQGNWGNIYTGDSAAAARYIEARLSKFAIEVVFNPKTTRWQLSYDGRNREPITLPVKFPLLLAHGVEGIAVGLACKILPHNFNELIEASIDILRGRKISIVPDFATGGMADFSNYNEGMRGGKVRVRAKINQLDKKTLVVTEIPFSTTTTSLIDSIIAANDKEKIKIRKIEDNTAENVEIMIHLPPGISPDKTIDALYAFTDCEVSISPNACVIVDEKPVFMNVNDILRYNTHQTVALLKKELEIAKEELENQWHASSLEKIFIENRIYRKIENEETWEGVLTAIEKGLKPFRSILKREITRDDIVRLTEIKIKRISKFDAFKADEIIRGLEQEIGETQYHLNHLTEYAIEYYKNLKKKYGKGRERMTEIRSFDTIVASRVAVANEKLYVNRAEGFAGYGLKKDEYVCECSDIDDIIVFREDGTMTVSRISEKAFVGKGMIHIGIFKKNDDRTIYNMIYQDGPKGNIMVKRFAVSGITRDKTYDLTKGTKGSKVLYFTANPNGESEVLTVHLKPLPRLKKLTFDFDFATVGIKGRNSVGNILTRYPVKKVVQKEKGTSTLGARMIWFDDSVQRLNTDGRGMYLGEFSADDKILTIMQSGHYKLTGFDLSTRFDEDLVLIERFAPEKIVTAIYIDGEKKEYFVKRFLIEVTDKKTPFIPEVPGTVLDHVTTLKKPIIEIKYAKQKDKEIAPQTVDLEEFIKVMGLKAKGNRLSANKIKDISLLATEEEEEEEEVTGEDGDDDSSNGSPTDRLKQIRKGLDEMDTQITLGF